MRLAPRSLFARMALVVVGGLIVAQVLSTLLLFDERSRWFMQGRINRSVHRMADAIQVLDRLPPVLRAQVAEGFVAPEFQLGVRDQRPGLPPSSPELAEAARNLLIDLTTKLNARRLIDVTIAFTDSAVVQRPAWYPPFEIAVPETRIDAVIASPDHAHWYVLRWTLPADTRGLPDRVLWDMALRLVVLLILLLVAVRWVTRPLSVLAQAADRLGRNLDEPPISEHGPVEVSKAAQAFNQMQTRLRDLLRQKAQMLAAVSHDLKTPVTRLRLRAELLDNAELRGKIGRDLDEMEAMVSATLDLMRGSGAVEPLQRTDLLALVESLQSDYEDTGRDVAVEAERLEPVELRPQAIRRCLANLIDNGLKYGERVRIRVQDASDWVQVDVEDEGPGIASEELERVFEPFYRIEASRNRETGGSGLGLSIARAIATEHAGHLILSNLPERGLRARLRLPRR